MNIQLQPELCRQDEIENLIIQFLERRSYNVLGFFVSEDLGFVILNHNNYSSSYFKVECLGLSCHFLLKRIHNFNEKI